MVGELWDQQDQEDTPEEGSGGENEESNVMDDGRCQPFGLTVKSSPIVSPLPFQPPQTLLCSNPPLHSLARQPKPCLHPVLPHPALEINLKEACQVMTTAHM
eukprot:sb/3478363/